MSRIIRMSNPGRTRRAALAAAAVGAAALLAGCGPTQAGSAAIVGDSRITDTQVAEQVSVVAAALGIPVSDQVTSAIITRMVTARIVDELAKREGVAISQGEVDAFIAERAQTAGGIDRLKEELMKAGIPEQDLNQTVVTALQIQVLAGKLAPGEPQQEQQLVLLRAASQLSEQLHTQVSPRFGVWNSEIMQMTRPADDLSSPPPSAQPPDGQLQIPIQ